MNVARYRPRRRARNRRPPRHAPKRSALKPPLPSTTTSQDAQLISLGCAQEVPLCIRIRAVGSYYRMGDCAWITMLLVGNPCEIFQQLVAIRMGRKRIRLTIKMVVRNASRRDPRLGPRAARVAGPGRECRRGAQHRLRHVMPVENGYRW